MVSGSAMSGSVIESAPAQVNRARTMNDIVRGVARGDASGRNARSDKSRRGQILFTRLHERIGVVAKMLRAESAWRATRALIGGGYCSRGMGASPMHPSS